MLRYEQKEEGRCRIRKKKRRVQWWQKKSRSGKENTASVLEGTVGDGCLRLPHLLPYNISYDKLFLVFFLKWHE